MEDKPIIFREKEEAPGGFKQLDIFSGALKELFFIRNPKYKKQMPAAQKPLSEFIQKQKRVLRPVWIYYPWLGKIIECPDEDIFLEIKTARNRNIITEKEQRHYRDFRVGIMGMSIGSNIIWPLVASGGPKFLRIADADTIEISNLNRMLSPITAVGENKALFMAKKIYETDPFVQVDCWTHYVDKNNIEQFISGIDLLIDEIDDLALKFLSREIAKTMKIPVMMVTNVGNNVLVDIERFDLEPRRPIFHGLLDDIRTDGLSNLSYREWVRIATKIVNPKYLSVKMRRSIKSIGKSIAAVPQISPTGLISGSVASTMIMKIANKDTLKSGRYFFNIEKNLTHDRY